MPPGEDWSSKEQEINWVFKQSKTMGEHFNFYKLINVENYDVYTRLYSYLNGSFLIGYFCFLPKSNCPSISAQSKQEISSHTGSSHWFAEPTGTACQDESTMRSSQPEREQPFSPLQRMVYAHMTNAKPSY